jgi:hypothetical protein
MNIREIIQEIAGTSSNKSIYAKIKDVNTSKETCTVTTLLDDMDLFDIRLTGEGLGGVLYIPKIGSVVGVNLINETDGYITMFSELTSIKIGDGTNGGLVKITDLVTKINNIENDINNLKNIFSAWVTVPNDGGAALKAAASTWYASQITNTNVNDIENNTIQHGNL